MIEQWLSDPSKITVIGLLVVGLFAFYKVLILPRQIHVDSIAQLTNAHLTHVADMKTLHEAAVVKCESDLQREREEVNRLRSMVTRNVDVVDKSTDTLRLALNAFENAHQARREAFDPKKEQGQGQ